MRTRDRLLPGTEAHAHTEWELPFVAVESIRTHATTRAVFRYAKIVYVLEGRVVLDTERGMRTLTAGDAAAVGAGHWCSLSPRRPTRLWTLYCDERVLRAQMAWILLDKARLRPGVHPDEWDGSALVLRPGLAALRAMEPLWRQISVIDGAALGPERAVLQAQTLFSQIIEHSLPSLLVSDLPDQSRRDLASPVQGHLTSSISVGQVGKAIRLLREKMAEPWTTHALANEVSLSRTHFTRLFAQRTGLTPMRFLAEIRLTEFTRLVEETDLSLAASARRVGWSDPRVAAGWFRRRFGINPSLYRHSAHPTWKGDPSSSRAGPRLAR